MRIFGWAADQAGCAWYRLRLPLGQLGNRGHQTKVWERVPEQWVSRVLGTRTDPLKAKLTPPEWEDFPDVLVAQRTGTKGPTFLWHHLARHKNRPYLVYEIDDNLWEIPVTNEKAYDFYNLNGDANALLNTQINIRVADLVTVTTDTLAEVVSQWNPNVVVLPNCVPQWLTEAARPPHGEGRIVAGWQGSPTHSMDWTGLIQPIRRGLERGNVQLQLMGNPPDEVVERIPQAKVTPWSTDIPDYYRSIAWDVALAPLLAHPFNTRGKSDLRVLEAAALGIPAIASDIPPYNQAIHHMDTGLLCGRDHEWTTAIRGLAHDHITRTMLGQRARQWAKTRTIEANAHLWEQAYERR